MYIYKAVTISSTAIIATTTISPPRMPGPSDTPLFSVVHQTETSASVSPTAVMPPLIVIAPMLTVTATATATVTMRPASNGSPYPAFNASNYPQENFTAPASRPDINQTEKIAVIQSNCTNTQPLLYTAGNQDSVADGAEPASGAKTSTTKIICEGRNGKNRTRASRIFGTGRFGSGGIALPAPGAPSAIENTPADGSRNENVADDGNTIRPIHNAEVKRKRSDNVAANDERVPGYVKTLESGPII